MFQHTWYSLCLGIVACAVVVCVSASSMFPDELSGTNYLAKRQMNPYCVCCAKDYDFGCCSRCFNSKSPVIPFYSKRSEPADSSMQRSRRYTGCGCCFQSRFNNEYCCDLCQTMTKRLGKRSMDTESVELVLPSKRMNPDCLCCQASNGWNIGCCERCSRDYKK